MFGGRGNCPGSRRRGGYGLLGALVLLALVGLALAFAPRMAQLATTQAQNGPENAGKGLTRGAATTEGTEETGKHGPVEVASANPDANAVSEDSKGKEPEAGGEPDSARSESPGSDATDADSAETKRPPGVGSGTAEGQAQRQQKESKEAQEKPQASVNKEKSRRLAPSDKTMSLSIPRLAAVRGDTVLNSDSPEALDRAAIKLPSTGFPWQEGANTYIAGHRIGWPGTETRYQFYYLPAMRKGDAVYLTDSGGTTYEYRVTEKFAVKPSENWVTEPVAGRDMVTLQTCTETVNDWWTIGPKLMESGPDSGRLIVRADKVATYPA